MEKQSDDIEQVFVIGEAEEGTREPLFSKEKGRSGSDYYVSPEQSKRVVKSLGLIVSFVLAVFFSGVFMLIFLANTFKLSNEIVGMSLFISFMLIVLLSLLFIQGDEGDEEITKATCEAETAIITSKKSKKNKKFNSLSEYRESDEGKIAQVAQEVSIPASTPEESNRQLQQDNDNIELAVEALVRLGFGKRKAIDWVGRAVKSGIATAETQKLIRFALSRGSK